MTEKERSDHFVDMKHYVIEYLDDETYNTSFMERKYTREESLEVMYCYYCLEGVIGGNTPEGPMTWRPEIYREAERMRYDILMPNEHLT